MRNDGIIYREFKPNGRDSLGNRGINDELKNICQIEHLRHRGQANFLMNLASGIAAYRLFDKKPSIKFDMEETHGQLYLF